MHLITYRGGVPHWPDAYITYRDALDVTSASHLEFYNIFREAFEEGKFYDLEGNDNYAFILLQDIRQSHNYKQMPSFETRIQLLSLHYPAVRLHALSLLTYRMK
ncbi:MAG TPA: hypothetical protein VHW43_00260, partial [Puia sp.]|nr:hypothetical protein [Puia sp.]